MVTREALVVGDEDGNDESPLSKNTPSNHPLGPEAPLQLPGSGTLSVSDGVFEDIRIFFAGAWTGPLIEEYGYAA